MHILMKIRAFSLVLITGLLLTGSMPTMTKAQAAEPAPDSLTETYGDWIVHCVTPASTDGAASGPQICEMTQELRQKANNQRVLAVSVQPNENEADITIVGPFGLKLSAGIRLSVEESDVLAIGFHTCLPAGCVANSHLDSAALATLLESDSAKVSMVDTGDNILEISISLNGFTAAFARLKEL